MALFEQFPYSNFHELNLDWVLKKQKENNDKMNSISNDMLNLESEVDNKLSNLNISEIIDDMYLNGDFDAVFDRLLKEYVFTQPEPFGDYTTLDEYFSALDTLAENSEWLSSMNLATSEMGNIMKCYMIGKPLNGNWYRSALIFADQDAREYQGTYVLANAIKMLVENLEAGTGSIHGLPLDRFFTGYRFFIIPTANPDGYKLCAENYYDELPASKQEQIKNMVEAFIRGGYAGDSDFTPTEWAQLIAEFGNVENYQFRKADVPHLWHGTLSGVDLHYNCFNEDQYDKLSAYAAANNWPDFPAPRNYIGTAPFECPENAAIKTLINGYNIRAVISMHQRGPTMFFQYKYGGQKFERNKYIAQQIANATKTPVSQANNDQIGFCGWYYNTYTGNDYFAAIKEVGWSNTNILVNGSSDPLNPEGFMTNPMPRNLQSRVYTREIFGVLEYIYNGLCNMCVNQFYNGVNNTDYASAAPTNLSNNQIIIDKAYFDANALPTYYITTTDLNIVELTNSYNNSCNIDILIDFESNRTPNILTPGLYENLSRYAKIIINKQRSISTARFYAINGDIWECVIYSTSATAWRLINPLTSVELATGGTAFTTGSIYYEPTPIASTGATDTTLRVVRNPLTTYWTVSITPSGSGAKGIYYSLNAKPYPSI